MDRRQGPDGAISEPFMSRGKTWGRVSAVHSTDTGVAREGSTRVAVTQGYLCPLCLRTRLH